MFSFKIFGNGKVLILNCVSERYEKFDTCENRSDSETSSCAFSE